MEYFLFLGTIIMELCSTGLSMKQHLKKGENVKRRYFSGKNTLTLLVMHCISNIFKQGSVLKHLCILSVLIIRP